MISITGSSDRRRSHNRSRTSTVRRRNSGADGRRLRRRRRVPILCAYIILLSPPPHALSTLVDTTDPRSVFHSSSSFRIVFLFYPSRNKRTHTHTHYIPTHLGVPTRFFSSYNTVYVYTLRRLPARTCFISETTNNVIDPSVYLFISNRLSIVSFLYSVLYRQGTRKSGICQCYPRATIHPKFQWDNSCLIEHCTYVCVCVSRL